MSRRRAWGQRRAAFARALGLDASPLRRTTDRVEAWIRIAVVLVFLVTAPIAAAAVGRWADSATTAAARTHAAAVHAVSATVQRAAPTSAPDPARGGVSWVPAKWAGPGGATRSGLVQAPLGARAGTRVQIWVDHSGKLSDPPLTHGQVLSRVVTSVALTPVAMALLLAFVLGLIHRLAERRRLMAWEAAWSAVEPQWTRRLR